MRERPILFSAPMVRAILDGRKTQTRRVVKPQPYIDEMGNFCWNGWNYGQGSNGVPHVQAIASPIPWSRTKRVLCPYGAPGDRLWVREAFALQTCVEGEDPPFDDGRPVLRRPDDDVDGHPLWVQAHYRATDPPPDLCCDRDGCAQCRDHDMGPHWRPSIHMPRWASRITLEITGVRVERLRDIGDSDVLAEGFQTREGDAAFNYAGTREYFLPELLESEPTGPVAAGGNVSAQQAFRELWGSINGAGSWDANPWVWVVEFKRVETAHG